MQPAKYNDVKNSLIWLVHAIYILYYGLNDADEKV